MTNIISKESGWGYDGDDLIEKIVGYRNKGDKNKDVRNEAIYTAPAQQFVAHMEEVLDGIPKYASKMVPDLTNREMNKESFDEAHDLNLRLELSEERHDEASKVLEEAQLRRQKNEKSDGSSTTSDLILKELELKNSDAAGARVAYKAADRVVKFMYDDDFLKDTYNRQIEFMEGNKEDMQNEFIQNTRDMLREHIENDIVPNLEANIASRMNSKGRGV